MRQSETLTELFAALSLAQGEIIGAPKDSTNPHFSRKYADLGSVVSVIREPFAKNGLGYIQLVTVKEKTVSVETMITHKTGQFIAETLDLPLLQNNPQGIGSAITYGRRYSLMSMAGVAPEEDDGAAASQGVAEDKPATREREPDRAKDDDHARARAEAEKSVRAYIAECVAAWAHIKSQEEMGKWWRETKEARPARFTGSDDPLYKEFKASFEEAGKKLPEKIEPAKTTITSGNGNGAPADKPKDDIPGFNGDGRPSESSIRMNFKAALVRCVGRDDCNEAFIKHVEPWEKSLPKPFTDEMYKLLQERIDVVDK